MKVAHKKGKEFFKDGFLYLEPQTLHDEAIIDWIIQSINFQDGIIEIKSPAYPKEKIFNPLKQTIHL